MDIVTNRLVVALRSERAITHVNYSLSNHCLSQAFSRRVVKCNNLPACLFFFTMNTVVKMALIAIRPPIRPQINAMGTFDDLAPVKAAE